MKLTVSWNTYLAGTPEKKKGAPPQQKFSDIDKLISPDKKQSPQNFKVNTFRSGTINTEGNESLILARKGSEQSLLTLQSFHARQRVREFHPPEGKILQQTEFKNTARQTFIKHADDKGGDDFSNQLRQKPIIGNSSQVSAHKNSHKKTPSELFKSSSNHLLSNFPSDPKNKNLQLPPLIQPYSQNKTGKIFNYQKNTQSQNEKLKQKELMPPHKPPHKKIPVPLRNEKSEYFQMKTECNDKASGIEKQILQEPQVKKEKEQSPLKQTKSILKKSSQFDALKKQRKLEFDPQAKTNDGAIKESNRRTKTSDQRYFYSASEQGEHFYFEKEATENSKLKGYLQEIAKPANKSWGALWDDLLESLNEQRDNNLQSPPLSESLNKLNTKIDQKVEDLKEEGGIPQSDEWFQKKAAIDVIKNLLGL